MNETPMSTFTRQAARLLDRRATAQVITGGLAALVSLLAGAEAKNKSKRKRKKRKRRKKKRPCVEQCPDTKFCFNRTVGRPLCGDAFARTGCVGCATDQDCVESAGPGGEYDPYCLISITQASDNVASPFDCGDDALGVCITVIKSA